MLYGWVPPNFTYIEKVINEVSVINAATLLACQAIIDICISSPQGTQTIADDVSVTIPTVDSENTAVWNPQVNNCALFEYGYGLNRAPTGFGLIPVKKGSKILMLAGQTFYQYEIDGKSCACEKGSASIVAYPAI